MDDNNTFLSRRRIIKGAGVATGIGIIGGGSLLYSSQPALAAVGSSPISASNLSITANNNAVTEVTVEPVLSLKWSSFSSGISGFDIDVTAGPSGGSLSSAANLTGVSDGTTAGVSSYSVQNTGSNGDSEGIADISLAGIGLVSSGALTQSDLPSGVTDGTSGTKTVDFAVTVTANSASGNGSATDTSPDPAGSFDVTLNNDAGTTNATGNINTSGTSG
ncbi:hypothetical protein C448_12201 [Halococcus morrhuae DSM 1307]|uniref:Uncharacterized protein n=1 Tax=Halococcus morrhuae DSM 1307 TaxID=931277 RepID=M0MAA1_HALMO|nr:hypothetical protein [Halococcus morrhuae]EMA41330.1 hypothetical protein C448_12201 [Halococcus morrhuae DSM 1307]